MRNVFDQYHQSENKLTHALVCTLQSDAKLCRQFVKWACGRTITHTDSINIDQQGIPGSDLPAEASAMDQKGLPDAAITINQNSDAPWTLLIENKIGSNLTRNQLERHRKTTARYIEDIEVLAITATNQNSHTLGKDHHKTWKDVFAWLGEQDSSFWVQQMREFMHILESQMLDDGKHLPEFLTMFDGIHINEQQPYQYRSAKLLLRNLTSELRKQNKLNTIGVDLNDSGRHAITRGGYQHVWDYLTLKPNRAKGGFTEWPHFTASIHVEHTSLRLTLPNSMKTSIKNTLRSLETDDFADLMLVTLKGLESCLPKNKNWHPCIHLIQRHFKSQRSAGIVDGEVEADLRTLKGDKRLGIKANPYWVNGIFESWKHSRGSNVQMQIGVQFPHALEILKGRKAVKVLTNAMLAMKPIIKQMDLI